MSGPKPRIYGAYRFSRQDPAISEMRALLQDHFGKRNLERSDYQEVSDNGGPSTSCVRAWLEGKTKKPQNCTLEAAGRAIGYHRVWQRMGKND